MVHFILDVVQCMNTSEFKVNERGTGSKAYPPSMLLSLLIYCYSTGRFSSRVIEQASYNDVAVRYICANTHPDHDTICTFRRKNRVAFERFFVHVLEVAAESKVMKKLGTVSVDGTKIHANASKHSAVSNARAQEMIKQLEQEVSALNERAEQADKSEPSDCEFSLPDEIARRQSRKAKLEQAVRVINARHEEKLAEQQAAHEAKKQRRQAQRDQGKKPRGPEPKAPDQSVPDSDQYNFTDPQSRIMKAGNGKHFDQCYNAQAAVDTASMLVVSNHISDHPNDKQDLLPSLDAATANGYKVSAALADTGYYSEANVQGCNERGIDAYIAVEKQSHGIALETILEGATDPEPLPDGATTKQQMTHKLKGVEAKKRYAQRKQTVEPVFGIIKHCMGFRQFLTRGKENVSNEWNLVCCAYNLKRIFNLTVEHTATTLARLCLKSA